MNAPGKEPGDVFKASGFTFYIIRVGSLTVTWECKELELRGCTDRFQWDDWLNNRSVEILSRKPPRRCKR